MKKNIEDIYPLTVVYDRYNGTYSGGKYTAWNLDFYNVPKEIDGGDCECAAFWDECLDTVGKGNTPMEAIENLMYKLNN